MNFSSSRAQALHVAALEGEDVVLAVEGRDRLRRHRGVAVDEGQCGRALEQLLELVAAGLVGGELGQPVLDDPEAGVGVAQVRPKGRSLGNADAAVVDREDRLGALDLGGDVVDHGCFFVSVQVSSLLCGCLSRLPGGRFHEKTRSQAGSATHGHLAPPAPGLRAWGPAGGLGQVADGSDPRRRASPRGGATPTRSELGASGGALSATVAQHQDAAERTQVGAAIGPEGKAGVVVVERRGRSPRTSARRSCRC